MSIRTHDLPPQVATPAERAHRIIELTASAWQVAPASPKEVARRAPHGYVPARIIRRIRAAVANGPCRAHFSHSW